MTALLMAASFGSQLDSWFYGFDMAIFTFFGHIQNGFFTFLAKVFTSLGSETYVVLIALIGLILFLFKRTRKLGLSIVLSVIIGTLLVNVMVKPLVLRVRPYNTLQSNAEFFSWYLGAGALSESDYCFPSGHTNGAFEIATALFLYCLFDEDKRFKKLAWIPPVVAFLVMISRVYLMVHYATDVIFGMIFGIIAGLLGYWLAGLICRKIEKIKLDNYLDLGRVIKPKAKKAGAIALFAGWALAFIISMVITFSSGGDAKRCAYNGEYNCYNESKEKYEIDGEYYCKIHYKELTD